MAKLSQLKQNKVRCVFVTKENGEVQKITNQEEIDIALSSYEEDMIVQMFNPTEKQKENILNILEANSNEDKIETDGAIILEIIKMLTDIEIDIEDVKELEEVLNEPSDLLVLINMEINAILLNMVSLQFANINNMAKLQPELLKVVVDSIESKPKKATPKKRKTK